MGYMIQERVINNLFDKLELIFFDLIDCKSRYSLVLGVVNSPFPLMSGKGSQRHGGGREHQDEVL